MKIGLIKVPYYTGGGYLSNQVESFLQQTDHEILSFDYYYIGVHTAIQKRIKSLLRWRLGNHFQDWIRQKERELLITKVRQSKCDVVISIEQGDILLHDLNGAKKIFYANAPTAHEIYFQFAKNNKPFDIDLYQQILTDEINYYKVSDYVLFCWNTHVDYIEQYIYRGSNLIRHPGLGWYGCIPQIKRASYSYPPLICYIGSVMAHWNNIKLIQNLVTSTPYAINFYGSTPLPPEADLRYQGFAKSLDILSKYQFGLHTSTEEQLRTLGFSSKVMNYLSYGLPTFSPEWQKFTHQLEGIIAYSEENFSTILEEYSTESRWQEVANAAYAQSQELHWDKVLEPLLELL